MTDVLINSMVESLSQCIHMSKILRFFLVNYTSREMEKKSYGKFIKSQFLASTFGVSESIDLGRDSIFAFL